MASSATPSAAATAASSTIITKRCGKRNHEMPLSSFIKKHYDGSEEELKVCAPCRTNRRAEEKRRREEKKTAAVTAAAAAGVAPRPAVEHFENLPTWRVDAGVGVGMVWGLVPDLPRDEKVFGFDNVSEEMIRAKQFGKACDCGCWVGGNITGIGQWQKNSSA